MECSGMMPAAFKKLARRRKEHRAQALRGKRDRARCINMANAAEVIGLMFPTASCALVRELAIMRTKAVASAFNMAYDRSTKQTQVATDLNCRKWMERVEACANDPSLSCSVDARTLTATEASYLTNVSEGIQMSFLCRAPTCMFFGMNDILTWIPEITPQGLLSDYHFRCPRCGEFFQPSAETRGQVKAAFCITTTCPMTGDVCHIPATWPGTKDMAWVNNQIEITARNMKTEEDLDAWFNRTTCDLAKFLREQKIPLCFQRLPYTAGWRMSAIWQFQEIQKIGYVMGAHLTDVDAARAPFEHWNEMIGIFGNHVAASRSIASRL